MAVKSVSIRIEEEMLAKLGFVAEYEGRSVNSQILVLIRDSIKAFESEVKTIDKAIEKNIKGINTTEYQFPKSIPGIGPVPGIDFGN